MRTDPSLVRKGDEALLLGDPSKARDMLGWQAETSFGELLEIMIDAELATRGVEFSRSSAG